MNSFIQIIEALPEDNGINVYIIPTEYVSNHPDMWIAMKRDINQFPHWIIDYKLSDDILIKLRPRDNGVVHLPQNALITGIYCYQIC